jgi:hypothetical protein
LSQPKEEIKFSLELIPPLPQITFPLTFTIRGGASIKSEEEDDLRRENGVMHSNNQFSGNNRLPLDLLFKTALTQSVQLVLRSMDGSDVRVYKIAINAIPKPVKGNIQMRCPWGEELKQDLPLVNNSEKDWFIRATLGISNSFHGPREVTIRKKMGGNYPITFRPLAPGENCEGKLTLVNLTNNEVYEYDLFGEALEPLAKSHLTLECKAKEKIIKYIDVTNPYKEKAVNYLVETDLVNASGPPNCFIPPTQTLKYPLTINPLVGGVYTGSISFFEENDRNRMFWYTMTLKIERAEGLNKEIEGETRKKSIVEFSLTNHSHQEAEYEVDIKGSKFKKIIFWK